MNNIAIVLLPVLLLPATILLHAQEMPTIDEIVQKAYHVAYYLGKDGRAKAKMTIKGDGVERERHFVILRRNVAAGGEQKYYVYFQRPSDIRSMVYMVWKKPGEDDGRWLYLPALDLVKRIAASDKRSSFVGSHFVYEDVSGRSLTEDKHELIKTSDKYFEIKCTPKNIANVEFSYYTMWIDRQTYVPIKAVYYDKQYQKMRTVTAKKLKVIQGYPTVTLSEVKDLLTGGETTLEFSDIEYDKGIPDELFQEKYLRRAPQEWLK